MCRLRLDRHPKHQRGVGGWPTSQHAFSRGAIGPRVSFWADMEQKTPGASRVQCSWAPDHPSGSVPTTTRGLIAPASLLPCSLLPLHAFAALTSGPTQHSFPRKMSPPLGTLTSPGRGHTHFWNPTVLSDQPLSFTWLRWFSLRSPQGHGPGLLAHVSTRKGNSYPSLARLLHFYHLHKTSERWGFLSRAHSIMLLR